MSVATLVLRAPSANRVYAQAAGALARAEAHWVLGAHRGTPPQLTQRMIGGMPALEIPGAADPATAHLLGTLSGAHGLFEIVEEDAAVPDRPLLRPLPTTAPLRHPSDLETILKYPGKTNEQFTALLVNLAAALSAHRDRLAAGTLELLDPLCGRGTTLNRALRLGLSPVGADIARKDVEAYRAFLTTWLREHRYKHSVNSTALRVHGEQLGVRVDAELAEDKAAHRAGRTQQLRLLACDTTRLSEVLPSRSIDALVADLPYGVQHGARSRDAWQRSPLEVLRAAAPTWRSLLRDGAGLALAYNRRTLEHAAATDALAAADLRTISPDGAFRHRVDASIDRDVLLAIPTTHPQAEQLAALGASAKETP